MFDLTQMAAAWHKAVVYHGPDVQQELFLGKLSRLGVKAPLGTPAAKTQLAHAIAKAQLANGGSGQFLGESLNDHGTNEPMAKAQLIVGKNIPYAKANYIVEHATGY